MPGGMGLNMNGLNTSVIFVRILSLSMPGDMGLSMNGLNTSGRDG